MLDRLGMQNGIEFRSPFVDWDIFKLAIQFNENGSSGSLTLYYSDLNQLDEIMKRLKKK